MELGHASLFAFLVKDLGLSNGAAAYRKAAVDLVRRFPQVLEHLRDGRLCMTTVFEVSKVLTDENAAELLPRFLGASKRDAKNVVAEIAPQPVPARTVVTAVSPASQPPVSILLTAPVSVSAPASSGRPADCVRANSSAATQEGLVLASAAPVRAHAPTVVEPRTAELSRVHLTVPRRLLEKLAAAKDALSHSHPDACDADVIEVGFGSILERHAKRRGIGAKPRRPARASLALAVEPTGECSSREPSPASPPAAKRSRHIPAEVWRAVWARDGGCCAWPLEGGGVCGSTRRVQFDHVEGWALGAATTVDGCRLLCAFHQDVHARALYGDDLMNGYTEPKGDRCSEPDVAWKATREKAAPGAIQGRTLVDSCTG